MKRFLLFFLFCIIRCFAMTPEQESAIKEYQADVKNAANVIKNSVTLVGDIRNTIIQNYIGNKQYWYMEKQWQFDSPVNEARFSNDETKIIVAVEGKLMHGGHACIYDRATGNKEVGVHLSDPIKHALFYKYNGQMITVTNGHHNNTVGIWNIINTDDVRVQCGLRQDDNKITATCVSNDEKIMVTGSIDGIIRIWDLEKKQKTKTIMVGTKSIQSLCFSSDDRLLAFYESNDKAQIYDMQTLQELYRLDISKHINDLCFNKQGTQLIVSFDTCDKAYVYDIRLKKCIQTFQHNAPVQRVSLSYDGTKLITASGDRSDLLPIWQNAMVCIWDLATGQLLSTKTCYSVVINSAYLNKTNTHLLTALSNNVTIWRLYAYTFEQLWFLYALHTWLLVEKPRQGAYSILSLLSDVAIVMRYEEDRLSTIWKTLPHVIQKAVWDFIDRIIKKYGK